MEGYLLIVSKKHYESMAELPTKIISEMYILENEAAKFLKDTYKTDVVEYEHGCCTMSSDRSGGCIAHFHLGLFATNQNILPEIEKQIGGGKTVDGFEKLQKIRGQLTSYLLYKKGKKIIYWPKINVLSQFIRRLLYKNADKGFDWRQFPHLENMENLIFKWRQWKKK